MLFFNFSMDDCLTNSTCARYVRKQISSGNAVRNHRYLFVPGSNDLLDWRTNIAAQSRHQYWRSPTQTPPKSRPKQSKSIQRQSSDAVIQFMSTSMSGTVGSRCAVEGVFHVELLVSWN